MAQQISFLFRRAQPLISQSIWGSSLVYRVGIIPSSQLRRNNSTLPDDSQGNGKNLSIEDRIEEEMNKVTNAADLFSTFTPDKNEYELEEKSGPKRMLEGVGQLFKKKPLTHQQKVDEIRRTEWLIRMAKNEMMERMKEQKKEMDEKDPTIIKYSQDCEAAIIEEIKRIEELSLRGPDPTSAQTKTRTEKEVYEASVRITEEYYQKLRKDHPDVIPKPIRNLKMVEAAKEILHETLGKDYVPGQLTGGKEEEGEGGEEGEGFGKVLLSEESVGVVKEGIGMFR